MEKEKAGIYYGGEGMHDAPKYPAWRYHDVLSPMVVENTEQDDKAQADGWYEIHVPATGSNDIVNFCHDLEDMDSKQMVLYAMAEFGVELPVTATEEQLVGAIWELTKQSPAHKERTFLLAQEIEMDYDEELATVRNMIDGAMVDEKEELWI